jgi:deoxycytidine triphosphate deaminase
MALSDREILTALESGSISLDPIPTPERYNASAVDLTLGDELFRLRDLSELQAEEPTGVEHSIEIDLSTLKIRASIDLTNPLDEGYCCAAELREGR